MSVFLSFQIAIAPSRCCCLAIAGVGGSRSRCQHDLPCPHTNDLLVVPPRLSPKVWPRGEMQKSNQENANKQTKTL